MGRIFRKATKHNQAGPNKQLVSGAPRRGAGEPLCGLPSLTEQVGFPEIIAKVPRPGGVTVGQPAGKRIPAFMVALPDLSRILVIRYGRLGDLVLLIPALSALRRRFPSAHISALVDQRYAPVLEMCSAVDRVIPADRIGMRDSPWWSAARSALRSAEELRKARYDLVVDFHGFPETNLLAWYSRARWRIGLKRTEPSYLPFCFNLDPVLEDQNLHVADRFHSLLEPMGVGSGRRDIRLEVPSENRIKVEQFLRKKGLDECSYLIGMNLGASAAEKMWPASSFAALADKLASRLDLGVLFLCGPGEEDLLQQVESSLGTDRYALAGRLGLKDLAAVISRCHLLVSNDSGPMHFGPALGVPTLGLFSLSSPLHYRPLGDRSRVVSKVPIRDLRVEEIFEQVAEMMELGEWLVESD